MKQDTPKFKEGDTCFFLTPSGAYREAVVLVIAEEADDYRLYFVQDKTAVGEEESFVVGEHIMKNMDEAVAEKLMEKIDIRDNAGGDLCTS